MDNQTAPAAKQTKGIKKMWLKIRASMKAESASKASTASSTPKSTTSTATKPSPTPQKATEPVPAPTPAPVTTASDPVAKSEPEPEPKKVEDTKPTSLPALVVAAIEVDDEDEPEEKFQLPPIKTASAMSSDKEAIALRYRRAQEVFSKYDMTMDPADWQQQNNSTVDRVEKKPRMRVRYTCHECNETFGRVKTCAKCTHPRCGTCVRYPPKRVGDKAKQKMVVVDPSTLPTPTTGACHECKTSFPLGAAQCENCSHSICSKCLQETVLASPATAPPPVEPVAVAAAS